MAGRHWNLFGAGTLGLVLVAGCSHHRQCCSGSCYPVEPKASCCNHTTCAVPASEPIVVMADPVELATPAPPVAQPTATAQLETEKEVIPVVFPAEDPKDQARRRTFADITARPEFAHAPDYSWLQGELQYIHGHNLWRLRYASVEEEDRYGGGVTLVNPSPMTQFHDGQLVRVEGNIQDTSSRDTTYAVRTIHALPGF